LVDKTVIIILGWFWTIVRSAILGATGRNSTPGYILRLVSAGQWKVGRDASTTPVARYAVIRGRILDPASAMADNFVCWYDALLFDVFQHCFAQPHRVAV